MDSRYLATPVVVPCIFVRAERAFEQSNHHLGRFDFDCMRCKRGSRSMSRIHSWSIIASPPDDGPFGMRDHIGRTAPSCLAPLIVSVKYTGLVPYPCFRSSHPAGNDIDNDPDALRDLAMTDVDNASKRTAIPTPNVHRLPVLLPRPHPHQPIRAIDAEAFADLHLAHLTSDVPDSVLFPFLHGLEGDNYQQNSFFAASSGLDLGPRRSGDAAGKDSGYTYASHMHAPSVVKVPEYRGLMWVACDDDEHQLNSRTRERDVLDSDEDLELESDDDYYQGSSEDDEEVVEHGELMQVDDVDVQVDVVTADDAPATETQLDTSTQGEHMHPQLLRKPSPTAPIAIHATHNHTSYFTSPSPSHHTNTHVHGAQPGHTIKFPTSESSPAILDPLPGSEQQGSESYDRRLSTSSVTSSDSTSSVSTSASDSTQSHYGFSTSASYSTTASSVAQLKDLDSEIDSGSPTTDSPSTESPVDSDATALTTPCTSPATDVAIDDCIPTVDSEMESINHVLPSGPLHTKSDTSTATVATVKSSADTTSDSTAVPPPDLRKAKESDISPFEEEAARLTIASSFRANDLLTTDGRSGECVFVSPQVPSGISLRNFGIQVPIFATLSDIVVYSRKATPAATRAAFALAEKFKLAIERKAAERKRKYEEAGVKVEWLHNGQYGQVKPSEELGKASSHGSFSKEDPMDVEDGGSCASSQGSINMAHPRAYLVAYNVFVLTDPLHVLAQKAPWLVNRLPDPKAEVQDDEEFSTSRPRAAVVKGEGKDHAIAPTKSDGTSNDFATEHPSRAAVLPAIDFGQRERDEMRELTKATEIIDDCVYLGNVKDCVPPYHSRVDIESDYARHKWLREGEIAKDLTYQEKLGDPFDSSDNPMGYDLCIECRDPALLIMDDQIRAAESHFATLDRLWAARHHASASASETSSSSCPPRPAPSASAVLHMTFPASPPCLTYTHWHVMPFLNFLAGLVSPHQNSPSTRPKRILIYSVDGYTESSVLALFLLMKVRGLNLPEAYLELQVNKGRSFFVYQSDLTILKRVETQLKKERFRVAWNGTVGLVPGVAREKLVFPTPTLVLQVTRRVLPFLYLGNLAHAQNAYMLHALGITHVVSVGECALVPPSNIATDGSSSGYHLVSTGGHGSLWMEEREGRIKVLDIKGVCDDGIDSLQHQLAPICEWMERAREEGGTILVHCRVGVSRSATVTIAYVMKHLQIPLVDAYLIVRSRRLNVLIQPNMRLLYNLCGWEVDLARERAKGDTNKLRCELARSLNWPYLAREVHRLNEKYLH
ncbi:PPS1 [Sanghuangporus sanghuang]